MVRYMDESQPIWLSGRPIKGYFRAKNVFVIIKIGYNQITKHLFSTNECFQQKSHLCFLKKTRILLRPGGESHLCLQIQNLHKITEQPTEVCSRPLCSYSGIFSPKKTGFFTFSDPKKYFKIAHNRLRPFFPTVQPRPQPRPQPTAQN